MSKIDEIILKQMEKIVKEQNRPFSFLDFKEFEIDGQKYSFKHGTIRNKFSRFSKEGKIQLDYYDKMAYYTIPGYRFGKKIVTDNHKDINSIINHPIYKIIRNMSFTQRCIHDIHMTFTANGLWRLLSQREKFKQKIHPKNKSISFGYFLIEKDFTIRITIQKTDTVNVVAGCSQHPVALDPYGIIRLTEALTIAEERLANVLNDERNFTHNVEYNPNLIKIPNKDEWIITLWHLGRDSNDEYSGEKFHCRWQIAKNMFIRIYSKELKLEKKERKTFVRMETQENPKVSFEEFAYKFIYNDKESMLSGFFIA